MASITLKVAGMKCGGCETAVQDAAVAVEGVETAAASHKEGTVEVHYDAAKTEPEAIKKAITAKGYAAS
jgi:copper chaperone CopZ